MHQLGIIGDGPATPGRLEAAPPRLGEQDRFDTYEAPDPIKEDHRWVACYADEEPDEFDGLAFGYGSTRLRAIADLMIRFPRED